ncbi:MAG: hypothetical protein AAGJ18_16730 [Bacteroidota bacterium]
MNFFRSIFIFSLIFSLGTGDVQAQKLKNGLKRLGAGIGAKKAKSIGGKSGAGKYDYPPAILMSSLLKGVQLSVTGELTIPKLEVAFLTSRSGLRADVLDANNKKVGTIRLGVRQLQNPVSNASQSNGNAAMALMKNLKLTEGKYTLKFYSGKQHINTFPIEVIKKTETDAYAALKELYFLDGPWSKYACINIRDSRFKAEPGKEFIFTWYATNRDTKVESIYKATTPKEMHYKYTLKRNGKLIGANDVDLNTSVPEEERKNINRGQWTAMTQHLDGIPYVRDGSRNPKITLEDDLKDGNYEIDLWHKNTVGEIETAKYTFQMKEGKIVPLPEADRSNGRDPNTLIEQGPEDFFIKRK